MDPLQSPPGPSAADRFSSPSPGSAKRRLFGGEEASQNSDKTNTAKSTEHVPTLQVTSPQVAGTAKIIAFQQALTGDGRHVCT